MALTTPFSRPRSFVRRGRRTCPQERAYLALWPRFGLKRTDELINYNQVFGRESRRFLEIGFGSGQSLLALAKMQPDDDFIGVETHQPGIGALLLGIQRDELTNLRIYEGDVVAILEKCIPDSSLDGIHIFFPDPWPKRRHHPRRLIQTEFVKLMADKLKNGGSLHLASDWQDYAAHMLRVILDEKKFKNLAVI